MTTTTAGKIKSASPNRDN